MKVNHKRRVRLSKRAGAIIALSVVMAITICLVYLGFNGTWLDSSGLYKLLPWLPSAGTEGWPDSIALGLALKGGSYAEYAAVLEDEQPEEGLDTALKLDQTIDVITRRLAGIGYPEFHIMKWGAAGIRVELPDTAVPAETLDLIRTTALLEFVDPEGDVFLDGRHLQAAIPMRDASGRPMITFSLTNEGAEIFGDVTAQCIGQAITISLDGVPLMSPSVSEAIYGGNVSVSGVSEDQALDIALLLQSGMLPVELELDNTDTLSASLGINALGTIVNALFIGFGLVLLLMAARYRICGLIADWTLVIFITLLFLLIAAAGIQLTLAGIAGLILSLILAADASVLLFERIQKELQAGRTTAHATVMGLKNSSSLVFGAYISTVIVAVVLLFAGSGPVQNFAVTLLMGALLGLFTAFVVSRFLLLRMTHIVNKASWFITSEKNVAATPAANGEAK